MDVHKHKCKCGFVWEHDKDKIPDSREGNIDAHTCVCGQEVYWRYHGDAPPAYVGEGRPFLRKIKEVADKAAKKVRVVSVRIVDCCRYVWR